jgi:hypothetical protein
MKLSHVKELFHQFNKQYFGNALSEPCIRLTRATKTHGYFSVTESSRAPLLRISSRINNDPRVLRDTLLHEMVHQYLWETGIHGWETHGEAFINEAARIGICTDGND